MNIFLDDLRPCPNGFTPAKTYNQCIELLNNNLVDTISFDHDLGEEKTGYDVAKYIVEKGLENEGFWPQEIFIHTSNPVGRKNILQLIERYKPKYVNVYNYQNY